MATDYLELNSAVLNKLAEEDPVKHRSLKRYLECQNIYVEKLDKGDDEEKAWQSAANHWNAWANELFEFKKNLIDSGKWNADKCPITGEFIGFNRETRNWMSTAICVFRGLRFYIDENSAYDDTKYNIIIKDILFRGFDFPGIVDFEFSEFHGYCSFSNSTFFNLSKFDGVSFNKISSFENATFKNDTRFVDALFSHTSFKGATFECDAIFHHSKFQDFASFEDIYCFGAIDFRSAKFEKLLRFSGSTFVGKATFRDVRFIGDSFFNNSKFISLADFYLSEFEKPVSFRYCHFSGIAIFSSIGSKKGFDLSDTWFKKIPDFDEVNFHAPPALDAMHIEDQLTAKTEGHFFRFKHVPNPKQNAKKISRTFRMLGNIAHQQRDWLNEMEFFAQETRSRRFGEDFPFGEWRGLRRLLWRVSRLCFSRLCSRYGRWGARRIGLWLRRKVRECDNCGPHAGRFWFGLIYEKVSDFGRSFARPIVGWVASVLAFALYYFLTAVGGGFGDALMLSIREGLVVSGLLRTGHLQTLLKHLYGLPDENGHIVVELSNWIAGAMMLQTLVSAFFLFLFFLAVRNHFRIR